MDNFQYELQNEQKQIAQQYVDVSNRFVRLQNHNIDGYSPDLENELYTKMMSETSNISEKLTNYENKKNKLNLYRWFEITYTIAIQSCISICSLLLHFFNFDNYYYFLLFLITTNFIAMLLLLSKIDYRKIFYQNKLNMCLIFISHAGYVLYIMLTNYFDSSFSKYFFCINFIISSIIIFKPYQITK